MELKETSILILKRGYVCDHCFGRVFAQLLSGYSNAERGKALRTALTMEIDSGNDFELEPSNFYGFKFRHNEEFAKKIKPPGKCWVCSNLFENLDKIAGKVKNKLKNEFKTFLVGSRPSKSLIEREEELWEKVGIDWCEPLKAEINREIGKRLEKILKAKVDLKKPDIAILIDLEKLGISIKVNPLYIFGYYKKLVRGIPQCKWGTPKKYRTSVEQIIAKPIMSATKGKNYKLHGCIAGNSIISLNECSLPIENLETNWKNHKIITYNKNKGVRSSEIKDFMKLNLKEMNMKTFEIKTKETGRKIIASSDHPFFSKWGMKPISKLKIDDQVAVNPIVENSHNNFEDKVILTEKDILKTINKYVPNCQRNKIIRELMERKLIPLSLKNKNFLRIVRLLAFLFGDGNIRYNKNKVFIEYYGKKSDLEIIKGDIQKLGYKNSLSIRSRKSYSEVLDFYGKERIISGTGYSMTVYPISLWILLVSLGAPLGNKIINKMNIPKWIKESPKEIKKEFLASLFGAELSKPRLDKRKYNRKSFNTPTFSINKSEKMINNGTKFVRDIKNILKEFEIKTLRIRKIPYTTRKDGNKVYKIRLDFSNRFENLIKLYRDVGFRYCKEREILANYVYEYFIMKKRVVDLRKDLYKKALLLKKQGLTTHQIHKELSSNFVSLKNLNLWLCHKYVNHKFNNIKIPSGFPTFEEWKKKSTKNLKDGLVWETIESIREVKVPYVYDLTTYNSDHSFFANGFLVSNSGREDISARCLAWRAFVLEILEPKKRAIDLKKITKQIKGNVVVKGLKYADMATVRKIKLAKPDKTYKMVVQLEKAVDKKGLKKLKELIGTIQQRTPSRVVHRRADIVRRREIKAIGWKQISKKKIEIKVKATAGLYIKELISGDKGRTNPSVAELLGCKAECKELDVARIEKIKI